MSTETPAATEQNVRDVFLREMGEEPAPSPDHAGGGAEQEPATPDPVTPPAEASPEAQAAGSPPASPPAAAPAAEPWRRKFKVVTDGQEREVEADEERVIKALQIAEQEQAIRSREQVAGARWMVEQLRSRGIAADLWLNPATNAYEARVTTPNTTAGGAAPATTPPETTDEELLAEAKEAYGEDSPAYRLLARQVKSAADEKRLREQRDQEAEKTTQAERTRREIEQDRALAEQFFTAKAKAFEGPRGSRAALLTRTALYAMKEMPAESFAFVAKQFGLTTDGDPSRRSQEAMRIAAIYADDREVEWGERLKSALPAASKPTPTPPPAVGIGSSAAPAATESELDIGDPEFIDKFVKRKLGG